MYYHTFGLFSFKKIMYIQIKKAELQPDKFGNNVKISMIGLYDESGKWIKWVKLNEELLQQLINAKILL